MSDAIEELLDEYLEEVEDHFEHLSLVERNQLILKIRSDILAKVNDQVTLDNVLKSYGKPLDLANHYLILQNLPQAKNKKKRNIFKMIFISMALITVIGIVAILLLVKSITPVFNINEKDGTLTLLGGKIVLESDNQSFFQTTRLKGKKNSMKKIKLEGSLPLNGIPKIRLVAENADYRIRTHDQAEIRYTCQSDKATKDFISESPQEYLFKLNGNAQCLFFLPHNINIDVSFKNGFLNLSDLKQDLKVYMDNGHISWKQEDKSFFQVKTSIKNGSVEGAISDFPDQAHYNADLLLNNGNISIR